MIKQFCVLTAFLYVMYSFFSVANTFSRYLIVKIIVIQWINNLNNYNKLNYVPPKDMAKFPPLAPVNTDLFGIRVFVDVIKQRSREEIIHNLVQALNLNTGVLIRDWRRIFETRRDIGEKMIWKWWQRLKRFQGTQMMPGIQQQLEKRHAWCGFSFRACRRSQPCQHPDMDSGLQNCERKDLSV